MKKNIIRIIICYIILILSVALIISIFNKDIKNESDKIQIIATIFPEYDFAKRIGGDKVDVKLLLGAGVESHTYEPSVKEMKNITDSDIFIYTGDSMQPWVKTITDSMDSDCVIVDSSENIEMIDIDEFFEKYSVIKEEHTHHDAEHEYEYDGHIWLNPQNAIIMIDTITEKLCNVDPENMDYYKNNAKEYKKEISDLDKEIEEEIKTWENDVLVFGGEFAYAYFIQRYDLKMISAYEACGDGAEPSVSKIKQIIDYINMNKIKSVFYEELSEGTVAKMISEETDAQSVIFYSLHNVSNEEIKNGENYVSMMRRNLENLKQ